MVFLNVKNWTEKETSVFLVFADRDELLRAATVILKPASECSPQRVEGSCDTLASKYSHLALDFPGEVAHGHIVFVNVKCRFFITASRAILMESLILFSAVQLSE